MPKVVFEKMSLERNTEIIKWCYNEDDELLSIRSKTLSLFPKLKDGESIETVVENKYRENEKFLKDKALKYENLWSKYNDKFIKILCDYLEINWPKNHDHILANVGLIPVCPRDIENFRFDLFECMTDDFLIETCAHELCHFLWFEKWKEIFPDYNKEEFEAPNIVWEYSEMVVDPILNSSEFVKLFDKKPRYAYDSFYEKEGLMEGLFEIYDEDIPIEKKIKKGFEYVKSIKNTNCRKVY